jgi:hypothetical protein
VCKLRADPRVTLKQAEAARNLKDHTPIGRGTQKRQTLLGYGFFNTG